MMAGVLPGVYSSSARTELAEFISSSAKPGGLHLAMDNRGVVDKATKILRIAGRPHKRLWALRTGGDLWAIVQFIAEQRNAPSIQLPTEVNNQSVRAPSLRKIKSVAADVFLQSSRGLS